MNKLFGTDGIRGIANQPPLTVEMISRIARAATHELGARKIVIGKDTRLSGYLLESALTAGFCSMGADVYLIGPMPTPGIAFLTSDLRVDAGVVISASHNPYQDNGIKFFGGDGFKLSDALEEKIERYVFSDEIDHLLPTEEQVGKVYRVPESKGRYNVFAKHSFPRHLKLEGVKVVIDCAHGAAYKIAPEILQELGANVIVMNDEPNGKNINDRCGAVYPQAMAKRVVQEKATIGIALDGDGDRAIFSDEKGEIVNGDVVMAIAAVYLKSKGLLNKHGLVVTLMSNYGLRASLEKHGIHLVQTDVGDRYVVEAMRKGGYNLGGEQSGHLIFLDHNTTGDGIITMLQLLAVAIESQKPLSELSKVMQQFPQALVNVPVREKRDLKSLPKVKKLIDEVELSLGSSGRINVRYSGTENLARVMVEGERQEVIQKYADAVAAVIHEAVGKI